MRARPHHGRPRLFLTLKGYQSRYLTDGMLGIADQLRGDRARDYMARVATGSNAG